MGVPRLSYSADTSGAEKTGVRGLSLPADSFRRVSFKTADSYKIRPRS